MKQNGAVYFYNLNSERGRKIRMLCLTLGLKIRVVDRAQYTEAIGAIAGVPGYSLSGETYKGEGFEDEMLILKGFTGVDVDVVIETKRGHRLGRIIREGQAIANTGIPGIIGGYGKERVIHSENAGVFHGIAHIGDLVKKGDLIAKVDDAPVYATLDGVLRGILRDGLPVPEHFKIADIDPRLSERENCFTISDKASAIAGGVLRAICIYENGLRSGEGRK